MNDHDDSFSRNRWLPWLLERGLCDPETAAEYIGHKLLSPEAFAQARKEYQRATANYAPAHHAGFTLRKPNECSLLEIWHIGFGPNITYGLCVADSQYLIKLCLELYNDTGGDTMCLIGPAEANQNDGAPNKYDFQPSPGCASASPLWHPVFDLDQL